MLHSTIRDPNSGRYSSLRSSDYEDSLADNLVNATNLQEPLHTKLDNTHDDFEDGHDQPLIQQNGSFFSSYINLTNTIIGAGMLGLPYAFANAGWILGCFLMAIGGLTTIFSLHLLSECAVKTGLPSSFFSVTEATVPHLTFLVDVAVFLQCFGVGVSYLIVCGGLMPDVMQHSGAPASVQGRFIWVVIGFCIVAPLSCFRDLSHLSFTSTLSIIFVGVLTFLIFLYALPDVSGLDPCEDNDDTCKGSTVLAVGGYNVLRVASIFIFAFSCQQTVFQVVNELRKPSQERYNNVIYSAIATATGIYLVVAISGYATYGDKVESNILLNYPDNAWTSMTRVFISLLVAFSYPLQCLPARVSMMALWARLDKPGQEVGEKTLHFRYMVTTAMFLGGSFLLAMVLDNLGVILALVGATGSTIISYILPGIAYYELHKNEPPTIKRHLALAMFVVGLIIMPIFVVFIFV